jgi:hypothetical protein
MTQTSQDKISYTCDAIKHLLLSKNKKYGDSALSPTRIFSQASTTEQLLVRIDDKLSRISRGAVLLGADEDVLNDLIGYLVLLKIALSDQQQKQQEAATKDDYFFGVNYHNVNSNSLTPIFDFVGQAEWDTK